MSQESAIATQHSKQIIQDYVKNVKELEVAKYALQEATKQLEVKCREKKENLDYSHSSPEKYREMWEEEFSTREQEYTAAVTERKNLSTQGLPINTANENFLGDLGKKFLIAILPTIFAVALVMSWIPPLKSLVETSNRPLLLLFIISSAILLIIGFFLYKSEKDDVSRIAADRIKNLNSKIEYLKEEMDFAETSVQNFQHPWNEIALLEQQIAINKRDISALNKNLEKIYDIGIIPPSYREIDCVLGIDDIFYNDLADTMREAILLYEDRVFKKQVIRGMDNILSVMGNMAASMNYMAQTLKKIEYSVSDICHGVNEIIELQAKSNKQQAQLLEEMRSTAYATTRIQESQERCEWYAEQHRKGYI